MSLYVATIYVVKNILCACLYYMQLGCTPICFLVCSPLSPSEGLEKEVLFDLELTGLVNMESSSSSPGVASEFINLTVFLLYLLCYVCTYIRLCVCTYIRTLRM